MRAPSATLRLLKRRLLPSPKLLTQLSRTPVVLLPLRKTFSCATPARVPEQRGAAAIDDPSASPSAPSTPPVGSKKPSSVVNVLKRGRLHVHRHWLRDACQCSLCIDPDSGQKTHSVLDFPTELPIAEKGHGSDGSLWVTWANDIRPTPGRVGSEHHSVYPASMFPVQGVRLVLWDKDVILQSHLNVDYEGWVRGEEDFLKAMAQLASHGVVLINNVPQGTHTARLAEPIGEVQSTFYGDVWDVINKPNAENVAYTDAPLGLHQDLLYMPTPPRIQILNCIANDSAGGESVLSDGSRAAAMLYHNRGVMESYHERLATRPIQYHYTKMDQRLQQWRPVLDASDPLRLWWSPAFQASEQQLRVGANSVRAYQQWLDALQSLTSLLEGDRWQYEIKLKAGQCMVFDNHRILHGRKAFDTSTGHRHLSGAYVSDDVYHERLRSLAASLVPRQPGEPAAIDTQARAFLRKYSDTGSPESTGGSTL